MHTRIRLEEKLMQIIRQRKLQARRRRVKGYKLPNAAGS